MADGIGSTSRRGGPDGRQRQEDDHVVAPKITDAKPKAGWTPQPVPSFTTNAIINDAVATAARLQAQSELAALPLNPSLLTDEMLDREVERLRDRLENVPPNKMAPDREVLSLLQKEQFRRARAPEMVDAGTLSTKASLEAAIAEHTKYLQRFGGQLADSVRTQRQAYVDGLRAKLDLLIADERICSNAAPTPVSPQSIPGGATSVSIRADDVIAALRTAGPLTTDQETVVRDGLERWRRDECWQTGFDPMRFAPSGKYHELRTAPMAAEAAEKRTRMCLEMLEAMRTSPIAAAAFLTSVARRESVEAAHQRMAAAMNVSSLALPARNETPSVVGGVGRTSTAPTKAGAATLDPFNKPGGRYTSKPMLSKYVKNAVIGQLGEHERGNKVWKGQAVKYVSATERAAYKLEVREVVVNGVKEHRLFDANGELFDTRNAVNWEGAKGRAIFVMNENGELFASLHQAQGEFHHSSLSAGQPVAAAGEMQVIEGRIVMISNRSGHYHPEQKHTDQLVHRLTSQGMNLQATQIVDVAKQTNTATNDSTNNGSPTNDSAKNDDHE